MLLPALAGGTARNLVRRRQQPLRLHQHRRHVRADVPLRQDLARRRIRAHSYNWS